MMKIHPLHAVAANGKEKIVECIADKWDGQHDAFSDHTG